MTQSVRDSFSDVEQYKLGLVLLPFRERTDTFALLYHGEWAAEQAVHSEDSYALARMAARCVWAVLPQLRGEEGR